jgi:hypothetical protein
MNTNAAARRDGLEQIILATLAQLGGRATCAKIAARAKKQVKFIAPRLSDLHGEKRIRDTGKRISNGRGRPAILWATLYSNPENDELFTGKQ